MHAWKKVSERKGTYHPFTLKSYPLTGMLVCTPTNWNPDTEHVPDIQDYYSILSMPVEQVDELAVRFALCGGVSFVPHIVGLSPDKPDAEVSTGHGRWMFEHPHRSNPATVAKFYRRDWQGAPEGDEFKYTRTEVLEVYTNELETLEQLLKNKEI